MDLVRAKDGLYFTDLGKCYPESGISNQRTRNTWKKFCYETRDFAGILLVASYDAKPPVVRVPLKAEGKYKVYVGLYGEYGLNAGIRVRLSKEACFTSLFFNNLAGRGDFIYEVFWKVADLTNQVVEFAALSKKDTDLINSSVAYLRLVPFKPPKAGPEPDIYLAAFNDAYSFLYYNRPQTKHDIQEQIEPLRDTPFKKLYWGIAAGDVCTYFTKVGSQPTIDLAVYPRWGDRNYAKSFSILQRKKLDILKVARDCAKKIGLEFHVYHRMGLVTGQPPWEEMMYSHFFHRHQNLLCRDRNGERISRLSYAYPCVQNYVIALYKEVASYGIDGINFAFHRGVPLVLFEEPVVGGFKKRYGEDPRQLPDSEPRLFKFRSGLITDYLRKIKKELAGFKNTSGAGPLEFSATVLINKRNNRFYNLDIRRWVQDGIIDVLIPYAQERGLPHKNEIEMDYFSELVRGTRCQLCPELKMVRHWPSPEEHYWRLARYFYRYDIAGISFWDIESRLIYPKEWRIIQSLAWKKGLNKRIRDVQEEYRKVPLKSLNGYVVRYPFWWTY